MRKKKIKLTRPLYKHHFKYKIGFVIKDDALEVFCDDPELADEIAVKTFLDQKIPMYVGKKYGGDSVDSWILENVQIFKKEELANEN